MKGAARPRNGFEAGVFAAVGTAAPPNVLCAKEMPAPVSLNVFANLAMFVSLSGVVKFYVSIIKN